MLCCAVLCCVAVVASGCRLLPHLHVGLAGPGLGHQGAQPCRQGTQEEADRGGQGRLGGGACEQPGPLLRPASLSDSGAGSSGRHG